MRKTATIIAILMLLIVPVVAFAETKGDSEIVSAKVKTDPGDVASPEWNSAKEAKVVCDGASGGPFEKKSIDVKVKSVYTKDGNISILLTWQDSEQSMDMEAWKLAKTKWSKKDGIEDKVALNWEIKRIKNFATKGCAVVCHSESKSQEEWKYHTETATERGDMWIWQSYRSNPLGYAEDSFVDDDSRKSDPGTGKAKKNETADKKKPKFMQDPSKKPSAAGFLVDGEAVEIKDYSKIKDGSVIPYWILSKFTGSMADVKAKAKFVDGRWIVMMQRSLKTEDKENDVTFDTRRDYNFGIAVFNNSSKHNSFNSGPLKLKFD